jgi:ABC-type branched-subunit amino acid transport system ATPase component
MMEILKVQNLHKSFGGLHAIEHCSFSVEKNSITGLIGPNGAGKTTMFDLINGLIFPDEGHVFIKERNVTSWPTHRRAKLGLARTFQAIRVFPELTALENVVVAFRDHPEKLHHAFLPLKNKRKKLEESAMEHLETVGIAAKAHLKACDLSYGQQKLLEIARCMATDADIFLLDEPAAGVNPTLLKSITALLLRLHAQGKTLLIVEHNMPFLMSIAHKVIVLDFGKELAVGTPREIQNNPHVLAAYLGKKDEESSDAPS